MKDVKLVVVGGGMGGVALCNRLSLYTHIKITLIDSKDCVFMGGSSPRPLVDLQFAKKLFIPYGKAYCCIS